MSCVRWLGSQAGLPMAPLILLLKVWIERAMLFNSQGRKLLVSVEVALGVAGYSAADYGVGDNEIPADHATAHQCLIRASALLTPPHNTFLYAVTDAVVLLFQEWPQWSWWQHGRISRTAMSEMDAQFAHIQMATGTIKLTADQDLTRVDLQMRVVSAPRSTPRMFTSRVARSVRRPHHPKDLYFLLT